MRFLIFLDSNHESIKEIYARASQEDVDFVVCTLDVLSASLESFLKKLQQIGKKVYFVPRNYNGETDLTPIENTYSNLVCLHKKALEIENYVFFGYGGGALAQEDAAFRKVAREWYGKYKGKKNVLVLHAPPYGTKLDLHEGKYYGSFDYRKFMQRMNPKVVMCGHFEENNGVVDKVGESKVINPGSEGMIIELK